ncbi:hypothetical protein C0Q70_09209 [Pomacea canaliculata]|uniref:Uncharacterized protein n=2 Tax=Pomacea canaliculata TaxID=400727 RepID=A0A2T7P954_POMCA|nr:hypothetical protein C0Q70_09209 [Pomacea canaliculata]
MVKISDHSDHLLKLESRKFRQFSRITAVLDDNSSAHKLSSPEVQAYDLIAVQPTNDKTFQLACSTLEVDIISLNMTEKIPFFLGRNLINLAIERGIHFEILYSPAIRDSSFRQNTIANAHQLISACKGKSIILSSGCEKALELRSPYDVTNLGLLFGLTSAQSKDAVSKACRAVIMHSEARRLGKSVVGVIKSSELIPKKRWLLQKSGVNDDRDIPSKKKQIQKMTVS